jgi:hypothetical protein
MIEPAENLGLDTGLYGKYCKFQVQFGNRTKYLKPGGDSNLQFETPEAPNGDKFLPSLLFKYSSKIGACTPQPDENYECGLGGSCAFDAARIESYEKANISFKTDMLQSGSEFLPKLRDLLVLDLAYIHLRSCKWKAKTPSHLGGEAVRGDDDDIPDNNDEATPKGAAQVSNEADDTSVEIPLRDDYKLRTWDLNNPEGIPWPELTFTLTGAK